MARYYAGIGSRETPTDIQEIETRIAIALANRGFLLRSGGARGSDQAFERGAGNTKEIFYGNSRHAIGDGQYAGIPTGPGHHLIRDGERATIAERLIARMLGSQHWENVERNAFTKNLHRRNAFQILGHNLDNPVELVVCWAPLDPNGSVQGGTKSAVELAKALEIPVYNLLRHDDLEALRAWVQQDCPQRSIYDHASTQLKLSLLRESVGMPLPLFQRNHGDKAKPRNAALER